MKRKFNWKIATGIIVAIVVVTCVIVGIVFRRQVADFVLNTHKTNKTILESKSSSSNPESKPSDISDSIFRVIENAPTEYKKYKLDEDYSSILVSKVFDSETDYFLWYVFTRDGAISPELKQSFSVSQQDEIVSFDHDEYGTILSIKPVLELPYHVFRYYRYLISGSLSFSFEQDGYGKIAISNGYSGEDYLIKPIYLDSCHNFSLDEGHTVKLIGLQIGNLKQSLKPVDVNCVMEDSEGGGLTETNLSFQEYDPFYSILKLGLPNGGSILVSIPFKKIVPVKEKYNEPCVGQTGESIEPELKLTSPSSTTVLVKNVWDDPVIKAVKGSDGSVDRICLEQTDIASNGDPIFEYNEIYTEAGATFGTFEFDLKTHKFRKVE